MVTGNTVVVKVSENASLAPTLTLHKIAKLFPPGVVNVITGDGVKLGDKLTGHPLVRMVNFTGSVRVGKLVMKSAANNITPVTSEELYDLAFTRLDNIVQAAGGPEAIMADPERIPQVHIRADVNAPWRCVAGAIYNVQAAGYPTVGFLSNPVDPNG